MAGGLWDGCHCSLDIQAQQQLQVLENAAEPTGQMMPKYDYREEGENPVGVRYSGGFGRLRCS